MNGPEAPPRSPKNSSELRRRPNRKPQAPRRRWPIIAGAALVVVAILGVIVLTFVMSRSEPQQPLVKKNDGKPANKIVAGELVTPEQALELVGSDVTVSF